MLILQGCGWVKGLFDVADLEGGRFAALRSWRRHKRLGLLSAE
jgi:hypothetical protein